MEAHPPHGASEPSSVDEFDLSSTNDDIVEINPDPPSAGPDDLNGSDLAVFTESDQPTTRAGDHEVFASFVPDPRFFYIDVMNATPSVVTIRFQSGGNPVTIQPFRQGGFTVTRINGSNWIRVFNIQAGQVRTSARVGVRQNRNLAEWNPTQSPTLLRWLSRYSAVGPMIELNFSDLALSAGHFITAEPCSVANCSTSLRPSTISL
ncbi:hypothetical protein BDV93DRAFT_511136 [Ceratobasidium sp. AG-I]|nr:hypothetical protein BDV93DRAFT_511136 [Ceratobasidium sp. AG-I]